MKKRQKARKKNVSLKQPERFRHIFTFLALGVDAGAYFRGWPGTVSGRKTNHAMRLNRLWALLPLVAVMGACDDFGLRSGGQGELRWIIGESGPGTRASSAEIPDTNDFILKVTDAGGKILYEGAYGDSPESLLVDAGSYTVAVHSIEFTAPGFSRPVYGDEQVVVVQAGATVTVRLDCVLENAGVRLEVAPDFLTSYPDGVLFLKSGETRLMYGYSEKRIAYFKPGPISLVLNNRGADEVLLTRTLDARTILTLSISAPHGGSAAASSISVAVDTAKVWNHETYVIGGGSGSGSGSSGSGSGDSHGAELDGAYSVAQAADHVGEDDVWVFGYIVGGDLSSAGNTVKTSKLTKSTHLAIAARSSVTAKASCVAVELPKGAIRDALNLVDHPDLIGSRVYLKGSLVASYFGTTGLKSVSDYVLK